MIDANAPLELVVFGISFRSASLDVLEQAAVDDHGLQRLYDALAASGMIREACIVTTCNRTELYASGDGTTAEVLSALKRAFLNCVGPVDQDGSVYTLVGNAAREHLFRVTCGLDSMMLGENQIVGQMRRAFDEGTLRFPASSGFERLFQGAFRAAGRARAETDIAQGAVSVASAGVHLASRIFGDLSRRCVVIMGAGETGRLAAQHFAKLSPERLIVLNRTLARAEQVAREVGGRAATLDQLDHWVARADIVTCAVSAERAILDRRRMESILSRHHGGMLALVDLGLPRNVGPDVNELSNVFVHDLKALEQMVDQNVAKRRAAVPYAEKIIHEELKRVYEVERASQAGPLIQALRQTVEALRANEVERATRTMNKEQRVAVDRATRAVINKLLHGPTQHIKEAARASDTESDRLKVINDVFQSIAESSSSRGDN